MLEDPRELPIEWYIPDSIISRFADNIIIQHNGSEFIISFFELLPPLAIGTPEQIQTQLKSIQSVRAQCVARVIVPSRKMEAIIEALQRTYGRFLERQSDNSDSEEE